MPKKKHSRPTLKDQLATANTRIKYLEDVCEKLNRQVDDANEERSKVEDRLHEAMAEKHSWKANSRALAYSDRIWMARLDAILNLANPHEFKIPIPRTIETGDDNG